MRAHAAPLPAFSRARGNPRSPAGYGRRRWNPPAAVPFFQTGTSLPGILSRYLANHGRLQVRLMPGNTMIKKEETVQLQIKLKLPESVAREAEARGLLEPESLESLLREELRRRRIDRLFEAADRLGAVPLPSLTDAEVEAELQAVRSRRHASHAGGR